MSGDCTLPRLGLSAQDCQELQENVDIIIHSAATVRFNEGLSTATRINVESTMDLINLAQEMTQLKVTIIRLVSRSQKLSNDYTPYVV